MEWIFIWFCFAVVTGIAAAARGRDGFWWFVLGLLFSFFALIVVLVMPSKARNPDSPTPETHVRCPDCKEFVIKDARVCKHCGVKLIPQE